MKLKDLHNKIKKLLFEHGDKQVITVSKEEDLLGYHLVDIRVADKDDEIEDWNMMAGEYVALEIGEG